MTKGEGVKKFKNFTDIEAPRKLRPFLELILILSPFTQTDSFLAGLGGSLSLYLGIAVTMVFEILEVAYDLVLKFFRKPPIKLDGNTMC